MAWLTPILSASLLWFVEISHSKRMRRNFRFWHKEDIAMTLLECPLSWVNRDIASASQNVC